MNELNLEFGRNNNPRQLHDGHFKAFVSHYPKFSTYVAFYQDAVESLFTRVSEGNDTPDMVAFPLLFLMRHTLELGYKYSLVYLCAKNSTEFDPQKVERHSLLKLHKRLKTEYDAAIVNDVLPESDKESFEKYYALTECSMKRFEQLDPSSTKTRYPNVNESSHFPEGTTINILELKNEFDEAMILLTTMADVIGQYDWSNYPEFNP
jgi:hypothetical protein